METVTERWTQLIIGAWILISPWLLGFSSITIMKWSDLICGLAIVLINAWMIFGKPAPAEPPHKENGKVVAK